MNHYRKIFSPVFAIMLFSFVTVIPLTVSAATTGLVPCGTESYNTTNNLPPAGKNIGDISNPCNFNHIVILINNITDFFIITGAAVSTLAFGYAGFLMMTAHGEMGKIEEAKAIFGKVLVGFLFMLSAWLVVHALEAAFLDTSAGKFQSFLTPTTP